MDKLDYISARFLKNGYQRLMTNHKETVVFIRQQDGTDYAVCMLDDRKLPSYSPNMPQETMDNVSAALRKKGRNPQLLLLLVTEDIERAREHLEGTGGKWIFDLDTEQLIVFENQPDDFFNVRTLLETAFRENEFQQKTFNGKAGIRSYFGQLKNFFMPVNTVILLINIAVFIWLELIGDPENAIFMYRHGAMTPNALTDPTQLWRLLTSAFLHFGIGHLASNMFVLWYLGNQLERVLGKVKYSAVYLICAIGSNIIAALFDIFSNYRNVISAGASGAIFGVIGTLLYIGFRNKGRVGDIGNRQLIWLCFFTLVYGIGTAGIDNAAHVGGLIVGLLCGVFLRLQLEGTSV